MFRKCKAATQKIIPNECTKIFPLQRATGYRIFTKDDYKRYRLSNLKASSMSKGIMEYINKSWEDMSKGYNFVIGVGKEEQLMFYNVEYFSNHVLG